MIRLETLACAVGLALLNAPARAQAENNAAAATKREAEAILTPSFSAAASAAPTVVAPKGPKTVIFISTSIPTDRLARLFESARGREMDTLFLLRGWIPPKLETVISYIAKATQRANEIAGLDQPALTPNIAIDPTPFKTYDVTVAPVTLTQCPSGDWQRSVGEMGIEGAERSACEQPGQVIGQTFTVLEPNILDVIEERSKTLNWDTVLEGVGKRANAAEFVKAVPLPFAQERSVRLVDTTVALTKDVVAPQGSGSVVLARQGQRINPLTYMTLRPMIVWNPEQKSERATVTSWLKRYPAAIVMVTTPYLPDGSSAAEKMSIETYPLFAEITARTQVSHTPTLILQVGDKLQLSTERSE